MTSSRVARLRLAATILAICCLIGCGPSEAELQAATALQGERLRLERRLLEAEARVRLLEAELEQERQREAGLEQERQEVPSKYGPGDFPTQPPAPRWDPPAAPGEERPPRDPRPPHHRR